MESLQDCLLRYRWRLRDLLARHGVPSNPGVDDQWILDRVTELVTKEDEMRKAKTKPVGVQDDLTPDQGFWHRFAALSDEERAAVLRKMLSDQLEGTTSAQTVTDDEAGRALAKLWRLLGAGSTLWAFNDDPSESTAMLQHRTAVQRELSAVLSGYLRTLRTWFQQ